MRRFHHIVAKVLVGGTLLSVCAMSSFAQTYTLTIQDGNVYVNGTMLSKENVPASLDTQTMNVRLSFSGTPSPTFELDGRYYTIENQRLREVRRSGAESDETTVVFRNNVAPQAAARARYESSGAAPAESNAVENPNSVMQQYVFELSENARQLNEMSASLDQRRAQDLIQQVHFQAEQAARFAQELPYLEMQRYMVDIGQRDQALYQRLISEMELEQQTQHLAAEARALPRGDERNMKLNQLRELLGHILDLKQENRQREIDQLEEQLAILKKRLTEREEMKERMIERRLQELVGSAR